MKKVLATVLLVLLALSIAGCESAAEKEKKELERESNEKGSSRMKQMLEVKRKPNM